MSALPIPPAQSLKVSQQLTAVIAAKIKQENAKQKNAWIGFETFMHMALYTPGLGYYSGGAQKFADDAKGGGDFVTAPEISPLFAQTVARQVLQVLQLSHGSILELGAGTGKFAADVLLTLQALGHLPDQYLILEVSDYLRDVQYKALKKSLPDSIFKQISWLEKLPESFVGIIFGNELLDAIPVLLIYKNNGLVYERGVGFNGQFFWQDRPLTNEKLLLEINTLNLEDDYLTELCPAATGLIHSLADTLQQGAILLLDYGFSAAEYYMPQRSQGTLMCHYQHYAHDNPLIHVGLQDITAHVNFSAIAHAAVAQGLSLQGYCNQAQFLINCGLLEALSKISPDNIAAYAPLAAAAQKLLSPAEMGELFKAIAFTKNLDAPLLGFASGDKSHTL